MTTKAVLTEELIGDLEFAVALAGRTYPDRAEAISRRLSEYRALQASYQPTAPVAEAVKLDWADKLVADSAIARLRTSGCENAAQLFERLIATPPAPAIPEGWISVEDRLPKEGARVLTCDMTDNGRIQLNDYWRHYDANKGEDGYGAKHWMPLPAAPVIAAA